MKYNTKTALKRIFYFFLAILIAVGLYLLTESIVIALSIPVNFFAIVYFRLRKRNVEKEDFDLEYGMPRIFSFFYLNTATRNSETYNTKTALKRIFYFLLAILIAVGLYLVTESIVIALSIPVIFFTLVYFQVHKRNVEKEDFDLEYGMPRIFSFYYLNTATRNFSKILGRGGYGSVFEGELDNGTKVAVKRLDSKAEGQGSEQFLAEVKTIGSINHSNLVRLVGYCAENSHRLLAYEYMSNGSLDMWIFHRNQELNWQTRRKIILGIAKGLCYLHEGCRDPIIHLDIKPQNILLDSEFKAKISDFGLATFIERSESQELINMRGTWGYLAPEWLFNRRLSAKVDVYSFGVVVLEILCGRKNLDRSQPEESCLLHQVRRKAEEDQLFDVLDIQNDDMLQHREEAVDMLKAAIWCLQTDTTRRPSMSMVLYALEGLMEVETISDYSFLTLIPMMLPSEVHVLSGTNVSGSTAPLPSILSGPR